MLTRQGCSAKAVSPKRAGTTLKSAWGTLRSISRFLSPTTTRHRADQGAKNGSSSAFAERCSTRTQE